MVWFGFKSLWFHPFYLQEYMDVYRHKEIGLGWSLGLGQYSNWGVLQSDFHRIETQEILWCSSADSKTSSEQFNDLDFPPGIWMPEGLVKNKNKQTKNLQIQHPLILLVMFWSCNSSIGDLNIFSLKSESFLRKDTLESLCFLILSWITQL